MLSCLCYSKSCMMFMIMYSMWPLVLYHSMSPFIATLMMMSHTKNNLSKTKVMFHAKRKHILKINENRTMFILWPVPRSRQKLLSVV